MARALFQLVDEAFGGVQKNAGTMAEDLRGRAAERAQIAAERVSELSKEGLETLQDTVQEYPVTACALFLGIGALLGGLLALLIRRPRARVAATRSRRPRSKATRARVSRAAKAV